ncbi:hypothetical protein FACS1894133_5200 [Clostridia bacterium]|nr:hypothetical protein FACS1894133_5200 [Clostridia bacterium]
MRVANDLRKQANKKLGEKKGTLTKMEIEKAFVGKSHKTSRLSSVKLNIKHGRFINLLQHEQANHH